MKRIERELTELFLLWVGSREGTKRRWHGQFGEELKRVLRCWGNWKNAPRGKPGFKGGWVPGKNGRGDG